MSQYWAQVRELYYPFDEGLKAPAPDVYRHEMPGGQYANLRQQAKSLGLEARWPEVCDAYAAANLLLGDIVKVTPSSKVVGDLALFMVTSGLTADDLASGRGSANFPRSVVEMMQGLLGVPEGGWPPAFRDRVLASARAEAMVDRPGATLPAVDFAAEAATLEREIGRPQSTEDVLSAVLYPQVYRDFAKQQLIVDNTSVIPTANFFYGLRAGEEVSIEIERGKTLIITYLTTGDAHQDGTRTVFFELNAQPRDVTVLDRSAESTVVRNRKGDARDPSHVPAPMPGKVSTVAVKAGDLVKAGDRLLSIEAMKMETAITAPANATVKEVAVVAGRLVEAGDLLVVLG
jgi:pyruvate carboxylase